MMVKRRENKFIIKERNFVCQPAFSLIYLIPKKKIILPNIYKKFYLSAYQKYATTAFTKKEFNNNSSSST